MVGNQLRHRLASFSNDHFLTALHSFDQGGEFGLGIGDVFDLHAGIITGSVYFEPFHSYRMAKAITELPAVTATYCLPFNK